MGIVDRLQHAWNAFNDKEMYSYRNVIYGSGSYYRPDRPRLTRGSERTTVNSIITRIAIDVSTLSFKHIKTDEKDRYLSDMDTGLNNCLTLEANIDQTAKAFIQDIVYSMFDEGCVAIVPVEMEDDPSVKPNGIISMRTGKIIEWYPRHVKVSLYDDRTGNKSGIIVPKNVTCIIENPFYSVINEPNSTYKRLNRKLGLLDMVDEQTSSGKLDMIIQLPYVIKTDARRKEAERRRRDIEMQLASSKYGIAYTDGTERITQLNRSLDNNLLAQIDKLTERLFSQLGMTQEILNGTADDKAMTNYYSRTIEPIASAIVDEMKRKFLTKTARTQGQTITYFRDPFKLVPVNEFAELSDKLTRNEILTSNEVRQSIGLKPSNDPKADMLINSNINQSKQMAEKVFGNSSSEELDKKQEE